MTALTTGWTPDVLAELPDRFRRACHWVLHAQAIVGSDGLPSITVPRDASLDERAAALRATVEIAQLRRLLYPEDSGGDDG